jgi:hypothetical protein
VLADLSRYTYRVAIANRSLIALDEQSVTFKVKDYRIEGPGRHAAMALKVGEFIRSFLTHVLSKGFRRSRHYGLFLSRNRTKTIEVCASSWTWPRLRPSRRAIPIQRASVPSQRCPRPPSHGGDGRCAGRNFRPSVPARLGIDYPRLKPSIHASSIAV